MDDLPECGGDGAVGSDGRVPAFAYLFQKNPLSFYDQHILFGAAPVDLGDQYVSLLKSIHR